MTEVVETLEHALNLAKGILEDKGDSIKDILFLVSVQESRVEAAIPIAEAQAECIAALRPALDGYQSLMEIIHPKMLPDEATNDIIILARQALAKLDALTK